MSEIVPAAPLEHRPQRDAPLSPIHLGRIGTTAIFRVAHRAELETHARFRLYPSFDPIQVKPGLAEPELERAIDRGAMQRDRVGTGRCIRDTRARADRSGAGTELAGVAAVEGPRRRRRRGHTQLGPPA